MGFHPQHERPGPAAGRLQCPFCHSYDVARLFVASLGLDSCECAACAGRWDEERTSGRYQGRSDLASIIVRQRP